ncbi:hypothetical protein EW146_g9248 [Bondarzewia mesenterica]|uniref:Uncharacterized protein n=1 Tax=Bondarzewia mesenterica TaxID=1095465 RepID=A0A4V6S180_9AGAM|nr:hypothetical protein EW146_g9248 [Bondarzewia mesenterica]
MARLPYPHLHAHPNTGQQEKEKDAGEAATREHGGSHSTTTRGRRRIVHLYCMIRVGPSTRKLDPPIRLRTKESPAVRVRLADPQTYEAHSTALCASASRGQGEIAGRRTDSDSDSDVRVDHGSSHGAASLIMTPDYSLTVKTTAKDVDRLRVDLILNVKHRIELCEFLWRYVTGKYKGKWDEETKRQDAVEGSVMKLNPVYARTRDWWKTMVGK